MALETSEDILAFWFSDRVRPLWFNSTLAFDDELREKYLETYQAALNGQLSDWEDSPRGALALVICLDQFPLNMFRGNPESFEGEEPARLASKRAIAKGFDQSLDGWQKAFLYLPIMHSEDLGDQDYVVSLFVAAGMEENVGYANRHREIVRRFGRFPHRNGILGRESTPEELDYLQSDGAFLG